MLPEEQHEVTRSRPSLVSSTLPGEVQCQEKRNVVIHFVIPINKTHIYIHEYIHTYICIYERDREREGEREREKERQR